MHVRLEIDPFTRHTLFGSPCTTRVSGCPRAKVGQSSLQKFSPFSGRRILWEIYLERYRSGHNGPDSKSGVRQRTVGSNPTRSANARPA